MDKKKSDSVLSLNRVTIHRTLKIDCTFGRHVERVEIATNDFRTSYESEEEEDTNCHLMCHLKDSFSITYSL